MKLFGGGQQQSFKAPPTPSPVRLPTPTDPDILAAGRRARRGALRRKGRASTILTDQNREITGSSGVKLGA